MRIVRYGSVEWEADLAVAWNQLADALPDSTVFQRPAWLQAWWKGTGQTSEVYVLAIYQSDRLVGVVPWMKTTVRLAGHKTRWLQFMAGENPHARPWIADPLWEKEISETVLQYLRAHQADWDILELRALPQSARLGLKNALAGSRLFWREYGGGRVCRLQLDNIQWESYFDSLPAATQKLFRRQEKFLWQVKERRLSGPEITPEILEQIAALNLAAGSEDRAKTAPVSHPDRWGTKTEQVLKSDLRAFAQVALYYLNDELIFYSCGYGHEADMTECDFNVADAFSTFSLDQYATLKNVEYALKTGHTRIGIFEAEHPAGQGLGGHIQQHQQLLIFRTRRLKFYQSLWARTDRFLRQNRNRGSGFFGKTWNWPGRLIRSLRTESADRQVSLSRTIWRRLKKKAAWIFFAVDYYCMCNRVDQLFLLRLPTRGQLDFTVREITLADYSQMVPLVSKANLPARIKRFWEADRCWGAVKDNQVIGYIWITDHDHFEVNSRARVEVHTGEIYLYDAWIGPSYKHKGLVHHIMNDIIRHAHLEPEWHIFTLVLVSNHIAVKMHLRSNFKPVSVFRIRRRLGIQRQIYRPVPEIMLKALPPKRPSNHAAEENTPVSGPR